ncbi:MAG TPA: Rrf2 family transcriptional regulator [Polyangiaceae bacterium]|nr:Rrf2 family transcriptional regulator [Polyangiaceae bacterium]
MQLTNYTDFALRALIGLAICAPGRTTVKEISSAYGISNNHLVKVVQRLAELNYVKTLRGKSGGIELAVDPSAIRLGKLVRELETELGLVECLRPDTNPCVIVGACRLKGILREATNSFLTELDRYTLADLVAPKQRLSNLLQLRTHA